MQPINSECGSAQTRLNQAWSTSMVTPDQSPGSPTHHDREDVKRWRRRTFNSGTHQILAPTPLQSALGNSPAAANI
ncbi:hypothetical protein C0Q70_04068 [Pomacea canaliculata]|uniref:Uncharacterized protein n=1 Tax=Pomacea canaliculata TaxID=400727 RepID=A0A2T7PUG8_POMCA|nr:hypothetical protein C0Q70_04068 [Pomacea canaliculata]